MNWYYVSGQEWGGGLKSFFADVLHEWPRSTCLPPPLSLRGALRGWCEGSRVRRPIILSERGDVVVRLTSSRV